MASSSTGEQRQQILTGLPARWSVLLPLGQLALALTGSLHPTSQCQVTSFVLAIASDTVPLEEVQVASSNLNKLFCQGLGRGRGQESIWDQTLGLKKCRALKRQTFVDRVSARYDTVPKAPKEGAKVRT